MPDPVAHCAMPRLIGHSACQPDGLRTFADLGSHPGLEWVFQHDWTSKRAVRLNSRRGTEGSSVSSLNSDRLLHSEMRAPELAVR